MGGKREILIYRIDEGRAGEAADFVAREEALTLYVEGRELVTLLHTPLMALELALGYMLSEGLISSREDVSSLSMRHGGVFVELKAGLPESPSPAQRVLTSGCGGGITFSFPQGVGGIKKIKTKLKLPHGRITEMAASFRKASVLFEETGGVHSAALSDGSSFLAFAEDIGRHNAVDKVFGRCLLDGITTADRVLVTTGRISSEILLKCAKRGVPVIVSRGAPTSLAITLAKRLGVTLVGFCRGRRMNVYTHPERVQVMPDI